MRTPLQPISRYTFGTGDIGLEGCDEDSHCALVKRALDAGVWFHSAPDYGAGSTGKFLSQVFKQTGQKAKFILKLYHDNPDHIRRNLVDTLENFGIDRIDVVQMINYFDFSEDWQQQGPRYREMLKLKEEGLVGNVVAELGRGREGDANIARADIVDGYIFYYALAQRNIDDEILDLLEERGDPIIALRTVSHIFPDLADPKQEMVPDWLKAEIPFEFIQALKPLFLESGCSNWLDFSMNFILSQPNVVTTIGSTTGLGHLEDYLAAEKNAQTLPADMVAEIRRLQQEMLGREKE